MKLFEIFTSRFLAPAFAFISTLIAAILFNMLENYLRGQNQTYSPDKLFFNESIGKLELNVSVNLITKEWKKSSFSLIYDDIKISIQNYHWVEDIALSLGHPLDYYYYIIGRQSYGGIDALMYIFSYRLTNRKHYYIYTLPTSYDGYFHGNETTILTTMGKLIVIKSGSVDEVKLRVQNIIELLPKARNLEDEYDKFIRKPFKSIFDVINMTFIVVTYYPDVANSELESTLKYFMQGNADFYFSFTVFNLHFKYIQVNAVDRLEKKSVRDMIFEKLPSINNGSNLTLVIILPPVLKPDLYQNFDEKVLFLGNVGYVWPTSYHSNSWFRSCLPQYIYCQLFQRIAKILGVRQGNWDYMQPLRHEFLTMELHSIKKEIHCWAMVTYSSKYLTKREKKQFKLNEKPCFGYLRDILHHLDMKGRISLLDKLDYDNIKQPFRVIIKSREYIGGGASEAVKYTSQ